MMIEFNGKITGECEKFLIRRQIKIQLIVSLLTTGIFTIPIILATVYLHYLALTIYIPLFTMIILSLIPPGKKTREAFVPKLVFVDVEEQTIVSQCEKMERFHMLSSVKNVVDYGEWYHFVFYYSDRDDYFVCQKNLLTKGSIQEFEELFDGKIIRKNTTNHSSVTS